MLKKMFHSFVFCCLCFWHLVGVFADSDTVKSVMEGDSVTLEFGVHELQTDDLLTWTFGNPGVRIAHINKEARHFNTCDEVSDGRFKDRLKLNQQTGSLTITNTRTTDSGLYNVTIRNKTVTTYRFNVTVYARLPVPVISSNSLNCFSSSSQQNCSLLCSVVNVSHVTLSWYKGNSLLPSTSVSDLSRSLSIEVNYTDNGTYSCVVNNPISNQTQHLDMSKLCKPCSAVATPGPQSTSNPSHFPDSEPQTVLISAAVVGSLLIVAAVGILWIYRSLRKTDQERTDQIRNEEITYADPTFYKRKAQKSGVKQEDEVVYAGIVPTRS